MPANPKLMTLHDRAIASVEKRIKETETRAAAYDRAGRNIAAQAARISARELRQMRAKLRDWGRRRRDAKASASRCPPQGGGSSGSPLPESASRAFVLVACPHTITPVAGSARTPAARERDPSI